MSGEYETLTSRLSDVQRNLDELNMVMILRATLFIPALLAPIGTAQLARAQGQGMVLQGVASVIDGDTLEIRRVHTGSRRDETSSGRFEVGTGGARIRLHGIDAPESGQTCEDESGTSYRCGQRAALALAERIGRKPVTCIRRDTDRSGRMVAVCHQGAIDLNLWMVANGHALAYRRYSTDYGAREDMARQHKRGLWAGDFVAPRDWRKGVRR